MPTRELTLKLRDFLSVAQYQPAPPLCRRARSPHRDSHWVSSSLDRVKRAVPGPGCRALTTAQLLQVQRNETFPAKFFPLA